MADRVGGAILRVLGRSNAPVDRRRVSGTNVVVVGHEHLHPKFGTSFVAQGTAGGTSSTVIGEAPFAGVVSVASLIPNATITGAATNNRKFAIVNKGQAGAGTTEVAALTFASGTNATGFDNKALTLSGTPANLVVAAGDVLALVETVNGTGMTHSGGLVQIEITEAA